MSCQYQTFAPDHILNHIKEVIHSGIESEFGAGRHKCAAQAYERGYEWGQSNTILQEGNDECPVTHRRAPVEMLDALNICQGGAGRHCCCVCAYHEGFLAARAIAGHSTGSGFINPADPAV